MMANSISYFCPAYYDEGNLPRIIPEAVKVLKAVTADYEIIIVEDSSPDNTAKVADRLAKQFPGVRVIHHGSNKGYGRALRTGFLEAKSDIIAYTDGDGQFDINELPEMLQLLESADVVTGFRFEREGPLWRKIISRIYNKMIGFGFGLKLKDVNCAFKVYKRDVIKMMNIESKSAFVNGEMLVKAKKNGFKIKEIGVHHYPRGSGISSGTKPGFILLSFWEMVVQWIKINLHKNDNYDS